MHTFSVIIPHHNIPDLLQRCLESIPDREDVQVIVVDDNSSAEKVDFEHFPGLERKYTEFIFDKDGGGAGHARNIGLRHADGTWLVFADADDFFSPSAFSIFDSHKDDLCYVILFKADSVNSDDYTPSGRHTTLNDAIDSVLHGDMPIKEAMLAKPVPWCKMVRRTYVKEHGILFDETMASNDLMFVAKTICWAADEALAVASDVVYTVTTRSGSLMDCSRTDANNYLCRLEVLIRYQKFVKPWPNLEKEPIIIVLAKSLNYGIGTFFKALILVLRKNALFYGIRTFFKIINNHTLKI